MFTKCLRDRDDKNVRTVREMVSHLLIEIFGFSDIYAKWLPEHLEHFNQGSIIILKDLKPDDFELVRYSTVVQVMTSQEMNTLKSAINIIRLRAGHKKLSILESAVLKSQEVGQVLQLVEFKKIRDIVVKNDISSIKNGSTTNPKPRKQNSKYK